jgi:predicted Fe-Mo cluster-binding NifX family protein
MIGSEKQIAYANDLIEKEISYLKSHKVSTIGGMLSKSISQADLVAYGIKGPEDVQALITKGIEAVEAEYKSISHAKTAIDEVPLTNSNDLLVKKIAEIVKGGN